MVNWLYIKQIFVEGPIQKTKSSFLLASRGSYAHLFLKLTDIENVAYFYDLNTKSNFVINDKNKIFVSGYFGGMYLNYKTHSLTLTGIVHSILDGII